MTGLQLGLEGRVAVVTGAGSRGAEIGNGRAISVLLARVGARVALVDVVFEWAEETRRMIDEEGGDAHVVEADVSDADQCRAVALEVQERLGDPTILVNNVGVAGPAGTALDVDLDVWDRVMELNMKSMVLMARHHLPAMLRSGGGSIVNLGSTAGLLGGHPALAYSTSKGAVANLTRSMAAHHGPDGVRVNCVAPGLVHTPMVTSRGLAEDVREARRKSSLLETEGTAWDVAAAVLYLSSSLARWITGVVLPVDAGLTAAAVLPTAPRPGAGV